MQLLLVKKADDHEEDLEGSRTGNSLRTVIPEDVKRKWYKKIVYLKKNLKIPEPPYSSYQGTFRLYREINH